MQGNLLLACLYGGLLLGGLRSPWLWTAAAAGLWSVGLMSRRETGLGRAAPWVPWLLWALASLLLSAQPTTGLYAFARWLTVIFFYGLASAAASPAWRRKWFWGFALCAPMLAVASFFIRSPHGTLIGLIPPYYNYTMFVEAAFFSCVVAALGHPDGPRGRLRALLWAGMGLALSVILLSRSRGALAAAAVSTLAWAATRGKRDRRMLLWAGLAAASAAALAPTELWSHLFKLDMSQWFTRPQIWKAAWQASADHPWFGEGVGQFAAGFRRHNFPIHWVSNYGFSAEHAESELLEVLVETGWPGLILFLIALVLSVKPRKDDFAREAASYACLAMGVHGLVDNMLQLPALGLLFFSALACSAGQADDHGKAPPQRLWLWGCSLGLCLALAAAVPRGALALYQRISEQESDPEERLKWLSKIDRLSPADDALHESMARAWLELRPPSPTRAMEALERARRLNPTNAFYPMLQAQTCFALGRQREALDLASRTIELEPNFLGARLLRAEIWIRLGRKNAAYLELEEINRRQAALKGMPLYSNYDQGLAALDGARFERARRSAASFANREKRK
jgi:O-antigen ligase